MSIVVLIIAVLLPTVVTWAYFVWLADSPSAWQQGAYLVGKTVQFLLPVIWVFLVLRAAWPQPTLTTRGIPLGVGFGLLIGGAMILLFHVWFKHAVFFDAAEVKISGKISGLALNAVWKFVALGVFYALCHSFLEEYYWRWFVFRECEKLMPLSAAIVISSLGFAAHHVILLATYFGWAAWPTWVFSIGIAIGGAFWAWLYHDSDSILGSWLGHLIVDAAIFIVGYDIAKDSFGN